MYNIFNKDAATIQNLLDRVRLVRPEIGAYNAHAGNYNDISQVGVEVSNGWLYVTLFELAQSHTLSDESLKSIGERFKQR